MTVNTNVFISDLIVLQEVAAILLGIGIIISGILDIILVIGARKKIKWVIYLWIGLTYAQSVSICAYFILFQLYWQAAVCLVYMAIISLFGIKMVQNIAVEKNNEYSEMTNLTNNEDV